MTYIPEQLAERKPEIFVCPFRSLQLGEEHMKQYLSDAKVRLGQSLIWYVKAHCQMQELAKDCPEILPEINKLRTALWQETALAGGGAIIPFRFKIVSMAKTVVEILKAMDKREDTRDLHDELQEDVANIKKHFKEQKDLLERFCDKYRKPDV